MQIITGRAITKRRANLMVKNFFDQKFSSHGGFGLIDSFQSAPFNQEGA
jgi:hypothetical protein